MWFGGFEEDQYIWYTFNYKVKKLFILFLKPLYGGIFGK